jgi:serine/threonine-protein kinase
MDFTVIERLPIVGRQWGNYRVAELIGSGGMGSVYRMHHNRLQSLKAIKVLDPCGDREQQRRFQQEALAASAIDSEKIVTVDDVGEWADGVHYIVMELIDGRNLADELKQKGPLSIEAALKLLYRLADTLALVHAKGIVHRDLKPQNILLPWSRFKPKLCDFGIVSVATAAPELKIVPTQERTISGTPGYQSPEQLAALPTDGRTDIYSLAVIGFEALTGKLPHPPIFCYSPEAVRWTPSFRPKMGAAKRVLCSGSGCFCI